ncbi:MAG TPA: hypothetical protein VFG47_10310 [Geminicoccaceae bacterium]|nr:hypothetical protein [Geminicoccaceae bacterium]
MSAPVQRGGGPPEAQLLDYVRQLERSYFEWRVAYLHLSKLRPHNRRDYQLRVAASEFESLLQRYNGHVFRLTDGDMVVFCKDATVAEMDEAVLRLRYLFSDDPLLSDAPPPDDGGGGEEAEARLCTWYDLGTDYHALCYVCEDLLAAVEKRLSRSGAQGLAEAPPSRPLSARDLVQIEGGLAGVDFAGLLRRQPICAMVASQPPQAVFTELYVGTGELAKALAPGVDLTASKWLFQHLTEALDRRLLAAVAEGGGGVSGPVSLNLNVATLLSPTFTHFSDQIRRGRHEKFLIELQLVDIYAELGPYVFARDLVRARGYMVCIDGLHHLNLPLIDRRRLGADFIKLQWSPDLLDDLSGGRREELTAAIRRAGIDRVILCRCGSPDAVRWGQELGVRLFQGRYVDSRLHAQRAPSVAAARRAMRAATD